MGRKLSENFYVRDAKSHQGFDCVQTKAAPDYVRSLDASSAFSWFNSFLLFNPQIYVFTITYRQTLH